MKKLLLVSLILIIFVPSAYGHPFLMDSEPRQSSNVSSGVTKIITHYSEAIEIDFSSVKVFDSNGDQIDNHDTSYYGGESSLVVTTPPLKDGIYTVTSKVLSKIDGHLVDYAFVFAVGDVIIDSSLLEQHNISETVFFPEAAARFPGLVGQTIVLGALISSLLIWRTQKKDIIKNDLGKLQQLFHDKFISITGIGIILVFASNIVMLIVQTIRLETSAFDAIQTNFGTIWIFRMGITVGLIVIWFLMERKSNFSFKNHIPFLIFSLALLTTTTLVGHGTASEQAPAIVLDYIHNFIAATWIGGIIFFGFILLPVLSNLGDNNKERMTLLLIPRFSAMIIIALGVVIITGPTLLWFLESDVNLLVESTYGMLIISKIVIAAAMISLGGYNQFKIQKPAEKKIELGKITVHSKLKKSLRIESALGISLLAVVALLANSSLPAGEIQQIEAQEVRFGFSTIAFSENAKFEIEISPFASGVNTISVIVTDFEGKQLSDFDSLKVKVSNPTRNFAPIEVLMNDKQDEVREETTSYEGEVTFGFSGNWLLEIEAKRTQNANENISLDLVVKPKLSELKTEIIEYEFPQKDSTPLYPVYDGNGNIWISDPSKPRFWKFDIVKEEFHSYEYEGKTSVVLTIDGDGKIWFVDTPNSTIGFFDSETEQITLIPLPMEGIAISLQPDLNYNIWIALVDKNLLLKYDQSTNEFSEYRLPTISSGPAALARDSSGKIWFAESQSGKIGVIDPNSGEINEFMPDKPMKEPFALFFDRHENLWIAEHTGLGIIKFNSVLETFKKIPVPDPDALPFGMTSDKFGNIWFAQHTVDKLGIYDPDNDNLIEIDIPTQQSFTQFVVSDDNGNVWFVEQRGNRLGEVKISEVPNIGISSENISKPSLKYVELVAPLISAGIIATSLFFVKTIHDKRRIDTLMKR